MRRLRMSGFAGSGDSDNDDNLGGDSDKGISFGHYKHINRDILVGLSMEQQYFVNKVLAIALENNINPAELIENITSIRNVEYMNPYCYIVGYIASEGGKNVDMNLINKCYNKYILDKKKIKNADILRYVRWWISFKSRNK